MIPRTSPSISRRGAAALATVVLLAACGGTGDQSALDANGVPGTVGGVGVLPAASQPGDPGGAGSPTTVGSGAADPHAPPASTLGGTIGASAPGNRVMMLGDSVLAGTAQRYGGDMCEAMVPLGWRVELNAEPNRTIDFGLQVMAKRFSAGWDAGLVLLGNNSGTHPEFRTKLDEVVRRFAPLPVLVLTVTETAGSRQAEVNAAIREVVAANTNARLLDWHTLSQKKGVLADGLHLTGDGRTFLAQEVAKAFGPAPKGPGACLKTSYSDDGDGSVHGTAKPSSGGGPVTTRPAGTQSTAPVTVTTAPEATVAPTVAPTVANTSPPTLPPTTQAPATTAAPPPTTRPPVIGP